LFGLIAGFTGAGPPAYIFDKINANAHCPSQTKIRPKLRRTLSNSTAHSSHFSPSSSFLLSVTLDELENQFQLNNFEGGLLGSAYLIGYIITSPLTAQLAQTSPPMRLCGLVKVS
jgi:hypothetical protein